MAKKPKQTTARRQNAGRVNVFRVESAQPYGWIVYLDGHAKTHFFVSHALALMYAREWAKANPPSVLLVVGADGKIDVSETYAVTAV
jgi:Uncharacterized protein conserved in bacteria (DUF2188)